MESRRKIKLHTGEETPCLPEQFITEEILPRLPAKSLLKFRCVSKSWCSLIGSKRFIKAHLQYSIKSSWFGHQWIFYNGFKNEFTQCCLPSLFDKPFTAPISHISDLGINNSDSILPVGCCNGLVCILVNLEGFILWNPSTKKFKNLPDLYNQIQVKCGCIRAYGFGLDMLSDDYNVFGMVYVSDQPHHRISMIYSLRSNSWKHIVETGHVSLFGGMRMGRGMFVSGKLHWKSYKGEIISFDLNRHVYGVVELPSYTNGVFHSMGVLGGFLSAHFRLPNNDLDFWLMKEYGVKESWDKAITVPYYHNKLKSPFSYDWDIPDPVAISPNGEIFLINTFVAIYNPKCDVLSHPRVTSFDDGFACGILSMGTYVESLASVAPDAQ